MVVGFIRSDIMKKSMKNEDKKKRTIYDYVRIFISFLFLVISFILVLSLIKTKMLPNKYLFGIIGIVILLNIVCDFLLFLKNKFLNVIGFILVILLGVSFGVGFNYVNKTISILEDMVSVVEEKTTYYILTIKSSNYNNLNDLKSHNMGIMKQNNEELKKELNNQVSLEYKDYDSVGNMVYDLELNEVDSIVVSSTVYDLLLEENSSFMELVKKVGEVVVTGKANDTESTIDVGKSFIVYLSGLDSRDTSSVSTVGLSDVNILAVVNPTTHNVLLVHIPRDYYVLLHGATRMKDKLTHAGLYGIDMSMKTVEDIFDVNVNAYVKVNFKALTSVVDAIDGIEVYSDTTFKSFHKKGWLVKKGMNYMNGEKALAYSRERYAYSTGDRHRGQNQTDVMAAIIKKISTNKKYLLKYDDILKSIEPYVATNIKIDDVQGIVKNQLDTMSSWTVTNISVNGSDGQNYTASFPKQLTYVMNPTQKTIDDAKDKINQIMKGE